MLRLFIGIHIPPLDSLRRLLHELGLAGAELRPVKAENLHVTLKFLGATPEEAVPGIEALMDRELACLRRFTLELEGAGYFHGALWAGVKEQSMLSAMALRLETAFAAPEPVPDLRFRPHVTLARLARNARFDARAWAAAHRDAVHEVLAVEAVHLYRSETLPSGARYSVLHTTCLREA